MTTAEDLGLERNEHGNFPKPDKSTMQKLAGEAELEKGRPCCAAWLRKQGRVCTQPAGESGRCRFHGDASPKGWDHPNTRTGMFSKYVGRSLGEAYHHFLNAENVHDLDEHVALSNGVVAEILSELEDAPTSEEWFKDLMYHRKRIFSKNGKEHMNAILDLIDKGASSASARKELMKALDQTRKISESARRARHEEKLYIRIEQVAKNLADFMDVVVEEYVTEPDDQAELRKIVQRRFLGHRFVPPSGVRGEA